MNFSEAVSVWTETTTTGKCRCVDCEAARVILSEIERLKEGVEANSIRREIFDATVNQATELKAQLAALREAASRGATRLEDSTMHPGHPCWPTEDERRNAARDIRAALANTEAPAVREPDREIARKLIGLVECVLGPLDEHVEGRLFDELNTYLDTLRDPQAAPSVSLEEWKALAEAQAVALESQKTITSARKAFDPKLVRELCTAICSTAGTLAQAHTFIKQARRVLESEWKAGA